MRFLLIALVFVSSFAYAEITKDEETYLKTQYAREEAAKAYRTIISERDTLLQAENVKCQSTKDAIIAQYEQRIKSAEVLIK